MVSVVDFSFADKGLLKLRYINVPKFEKNRVFFSNLMPHLPHLYLTL